MPTTQELDLICGHNEPTLFEMKTELIRIRSTEEEKEAFEAASHHAGLPMSAWVRERLRRAAIRELTEAGKQIAFLQAGQGVK